MTDDEGYGSHDEEWYLYDGKKNLSFRESCKRIGKYEAEMDKVEMMIWMIH